MLKKVIIGGFLFCLGVAGIASFAYLKTSDGTFAGPAHGGESMATHVEIPRGAGGKLVAKRLEDAGVIESSRRFYLFARFFSDKLKGIEAGSFTIPAKASYSQILDILQHAEVEERSVTIPEGLRKEEIYGLLVQAGFGSLDDYTTLEKDSALRKEFGVPRVGANGQARIPGGIEGYLYPDTYKFPKRFTPKQVLVAMRKQLDAKVTPKMRARMKEMRWSLHKVLTLAAIVEKETAAPEERPKISGVFHNRIKKGMKMQTDPSIIYGIKNYDGNIRKKDILDPHPYNTYVIKGLPPGPIAAPGYDAIHAVLYPEETDALFFVSRNNGTHVFCPTLACHEAAVQKWQVEYFRKKR